MSATLTIGDKIGFSYLKEVEKDNSTCYGYPTLVDYSKNAKSYFGEVTGVRDIKESPLSKATLQYGNIKGERSRFIYTMELENGDVKAFYGGRMVNPVTQAKPKASPMLKAVSKLRKLAAAVRKNG
jgi:hypothetical protein